MAIITHQIEKSNNFCEKAKIFPGGCEGVGIVV